MSVRRLIINADDLGYTRGINEAIVRCARQGLLRSATIMAGGAAFEHAVDVARDAPDLGIGVHLAMTELRPVLNAVWLPGLLNGAKTLPAAAWTLYRLLATNRAVLESLRHELSGQMEKVLARGIQPTHVDSHKHLHALPIILDVVLDVARQFGVRWIRNPFDDTAVLSMDRVVHPRSRGTFRAQSAKARAIRIFKSCFETRVFRAGLASPGHFFGVALTGVWSADALALLARHLPPGVSEVMFHPGDCDAELRGMRTRLLDQREVERDLLLSESVRDLIRAHDISLISYGEIVS
ncbi:MAG: carbohydrate deacetylase [Syntrophobacteraceae bacterium]